MRTLIQGRRNSFKSEGPTTLGVRKIFNPFAANVPVMEKPGTTFASVICVKKICGKVIF